MPMSDVPAPLGIELVLPCRWEGIGATRRFIVTYLKPFVRSEAECERVAHAAQTLLDAAVERCEAGTVVCRVSLDAGTATVHVACPDSSTDARLALAA